MKSFLNFIRKNGLYAFINLFGLTVSLAFVVSVPVSWLLTDAWLSQFSYSTGAWLQWLLILASGVLSCAVAFLTVLYQSIVAINTNPVIALRKED